MPNDKTLKPNDEFLEVWLKYKSYIELHNQIKNYNGFIKNTLNELKEKEFNKVEKEILNYIFSFKETREIACIGTILLDGIISFLTRLFFYSEPSETEILGMEFIKGFFVKNKRYLKKYNNQEEQFEEFRRITEKYCDSLYDKLRIITNFNSSNYTNLRFKSHISKYIQIPSGFELYNETQKKELLKDFQ